MIKSNEVTAIETLFNIQTKQGPTVPYHYNDAQLFLDHHDEPNDRVRMIIAKCRQKGFSSALLAKFAIRCLGKSGTHAVTMSHEGEATTRLFDRAQFYLRTMNGPRPNLGRNSRNELFFPKTESTFYIGTAGAKAFGRGDTITDLHCSEYAFWEDPVKHSAGAFQAVPVTGRIYLESTGNGRNNDFYYVWKHAEGMGFTRIFYPWWADTEYELDPPPHIKQWKPDVPQHNPYMLEMQKEFNLSDRKMYFYEMKLRELREDMKLMQQEYPARPEECFQATGGSIFNNVVLSKNKAWDIGRFGFYYIYELKGHPVPSFHYIIGGDPSGGTGNDDAAMIVICVETGEQVFELANDKINPIEFGRLLCAVGDKYNKAFIVCESNNHGAAVIPYLRENYDKTKLYKRKLATKSSPPQYGWMNSDTSKHALVGLMQESLEELILYGQQTVTELEGFEETPEGRMSGKSDNLVIATGLAMLGYKKYSYLRDEYRQSLMVRPVVQKVKVCYTDTSLEEIIGNIAKRHSERGKSQVGAGYPYSSLN